MGNQISECSIVILDICFSNFASMLMITNVSIPLSFLSFEGVALIAMYLIISVAAFYD